MTSRTFARSAAVFGAAAALTFAAAGAAMAATTSHEVDGNLLSVTFTKENTADVALCFAAAAPTAAAPGLVETLQDASTGDINALFDLVSGDTAVTVLKTDEIIPNPLPSVIFSSQTVSAELDPNVYTLISRCSGSELEINPGVIVGNPIEAIMGSASMGSSNEGLGAMSSVLQGGDSPLGDLLSSAIG